MSCGYKIVSNFIGLYKLPGSKKKHISYLTPKAPTFFIGICQLRPKHVFIPSALHTTQFQIWDINK